MERLPSLTTSALAIAAALSSGCSDEPLAPPDAAATAEMPFSLSPEDGTSLRVALLFAGQQSVRGLQERGAAGRVAAAFAAVAGRVEAKDRAGTARGIAGATLAVNQYRELAHDVAAAVDLEAMDLTLLRAAALVTAASTHSPTTIETERQP